MQVQQLSILGLGLVLSRRAGGGGALPVVAITNPLVAFLGGSRIRQAGVGSNGDVNELTGGAASWMKALDPRLRYTNWFENGANENSFDMNGMMFAADGNGFGSMLARLPKLLASRADIVVVDLTSNSIQWGITVASYCNEAKNIANIIQAAGKRVCFLSVVERPTSVGGHWSSGASPRLLIPAINAEMQSWAAAQGHAYADIRSVLIDFNDPDRNPLPFGVRDGTHWSTLGAYEQAKVINAALAPWVSGSATTLITGPNLLVNPAFEGTGGTITGAGLTGQAPDGWTLSRATSSTSAATVAASVVDIAGTRWLRLLVNTSAMSPSNCEGVVLTGTLPALTAGAWYAGTAQVDVKAWGGWRTAARIAMGAGGNGASALSGINASATAMTSPEWSLVPLPWPAEAYIARPETFAARAGTTVGAFAISIFFAQASGQGEILIALPAMGTIPDPNGLMFDAADTTQIAWVTPAAQTIPEESPAFSLQLQTNKPRARFALSGADAALFQVDVFGRMTGPTFDFEAPADAGGNNVYDVTITATDFNPANGSAVLPMQITVTDVDDGFSDNFDRANGELSAPWVKSGAGTGTMIVSSNRVGSTAGTGRAFYAAPQQGDTTDQQITFSQRASSGGSGPQAVICGVDTENWLAVRPGTTGIMRLSRLDNGVATVIGDATFYTPYVGGVRITAQLLQNTARIYQNGVLIGEFPNIVVPSTWKRSGWIAGTASLNPMADNWNNRVALPLVSLIGLRNLTVTPTTHVASSGDYVGAVSNRTAGAAMDVASVTGPGGTWIADGDLLRCIAPAFGTHTVTLSETLPAAVNSGRTSVVTVTVT